MTRIIAGFAGSRELKVPTAGTRPTSDRVREAVFSVLEARDAIAGARVLDLYAGSGALGLEALSRGAAQVTMVEKNAKAAGICSRNADLVRDAGKLPASSTKVVTAAVQSYLHTADAASGATDGFDLVFIDPPYDLPEQELGHALAALIPRLSAGAVVVLERSTRSAAPVLPAELTCDRVKNYGETAILWLSTT